MIRPSRQILRPAKIFLAISLLMAEALLPGSIHGKSTDSHVVQLSIDDAIGPATEDYIARALESAVDGGAEMVVIRIDTPGGLDTAMRGIIKSIGNSPIPVATYVAPTGARAASAGTYILFASHIAAMAPGTNLGTARPVQIGGIPSPGSGEKEKDRTDHGDADSMKMKAINDAAAYIRGLARLHGRNEEWAEKAVRDAASLPALEALKLNVVDIVASDMADLLKQMDGREVLVEGRRRTLNTAGLSIRQIDPDWRSRMLSVITNPNIAYILLLIGIYGLILEFYNPGSIVPGTVGAIALLLALYSFQLLPINYAGMALILLGVALMVGEAFEPSFGVLGIGGITAFVIGSIILIDTELPGFGINISVIVTFAAASAVIFIFLVGLAIKARRRPVVSGAEELIGGEAVVINDFDGRGTVSIHSETWNALSSTALKKGQQVKVTGMKGLVLEVEPKKNSRREENND